MNRIPGLLAGIALILLAMGIEVLPALGQTNVSSAANRTPPPAGWQEKWMGMYEQQDRAGKIAPPGFQVDYPPEPDTGARRV